MSSPLPSVLVVDDEPENLKALERTLRSKFNVFTFSSPANALAEVEKTQFTVVISDQRMPEMLGTDFLTEVAKRSPLATRMILTGFIDSKEMIEAINRAEIYRYITKPWDNTDLITAILQGVEYHRIKSENEGLIKGLEKKNKDLSALTTQLESLVDQRTRELKKANERLEQLAMTDPLTRLHNRRAFYERFDQEVERATRYNHTITVAMIDVDHFKPFNDMEGHVFGDEALKKVARIFTTGLRKTDVLCRYGGEEFAIMMPETDHEIGLAICERIRVGVEGTEFQGQARAAFLTISVGVSGFPLHGRTREQLIRLADEALYQAKRMGRNRVVSTA